MLSLGALQTVYQGENEDDLVLQILGYKPLPGKEEKYRLHISDGRYSTSRTVLNPEMNNLILEQKTGKIYSYKSQISLPESRRNAGPNFTEHPSSQPRWPCKWSVW